MAKAVTIRPMMDNETEQSFEETEPDVPPDVAYSDDTELRYAPLEITSEDADPVEQVASSGSDRAEDSPVADDAIEMMAMPPVDDFDIEGALAAVASLSDVLAEEEAAEQVRFAQAEADARDAAERQARLEHPELFFPMPQPLALQRGQMPSVVPALLLILIGAWLTFSLTTGAAPPDPALMAAVAASGIAVTLFVRWLSSGRWARGSLFFALLLLLSGLTLIYLMQPASMGIVEGWPLLLVAVGVAFLLAGLMALPVDRRVLLPALAFVVAGGTALALTTGVIGSTVMTLAASLWPVVVVVLAAIWILPMVFRQRR